MFEKSPDQVLIGIVDACEKGCSFQRNACLILGRCMPMRSWESHQISFPIVSC